MCYMKKEGYDYCKTPGCKEIKLKRMDTCHVCAKHFGAKKDGVRYSPWKKNGKERWKRNSRYKRY